MKKYIKVIIISLTILFSIFCIYNLFIYQQNPSLWALDSGFDGSYDGGFSGGGYSGGYSSSDDGLGIIELIFMFIQHPIQFLITVGVVFVLVVIFSLISDFNEKRKKKKNKLDIKEMSVKNTNIINVNENILSNYGYTASEVVKEAYDIYYRVQIAWMNNTLEDVRGVLSDEMFNMYKTQLLTLTAKKQKNMMEDITCSYGFIKSIKEHNNELSIDVALSVFCKDYIIDTKTNKIVRGNKENKFYNYTLTFVVNKKIEIDKCPNCSAPLKGSGTSVKCEYCGSIINRKSSNIVMTKKRL